MQKWLLLNDLFLVPLSLTGDGYGRWTTKNIFIFYIFSWMVIVTILSIIQVLLIKWFIWVSDCDGQMLIWYCHLLFLQIKNLLNYTLIVVKLDVWVPLLRAFTSCKCLEVYNELTLAVLTLGAELCCKVHVCYHFYRESFLFSWVMTFGLQLEEQMGLCIPLCYLMYIA